MTGRSSETFVFGPFHLDPANGLWRGDTEVPLPPRALSVADALVRQAGRVVSKGDLLETCWPDAFVTEASLLEAIRVLRTALGDDRRHPQYIQTVHRRGYRFVAPVSTRTGPLATETTVESTEAVPPPPPVPPPFFSGPEWRPIVRMMVGATLATAITAVALAAFGPRPGRVGHFSIALPSPLQFDSLNGAVAASPDGMRFAVVAMDDGRPRLFIRSVDRPMPVLLADAGGASHPFFSPDGTRVGFFADRRLQVVEVATGNVRALADVTSGAGAAWTGNDEIVFGGGPGGGLARVKAAGGSIDVLVRPQAHSADVRFGWPDVLPGRRGVIFTVVTPAGSDVAILDPGATRYRVLVPGAAFGRYAPTGHLVFEREGQLTAALFSVERGSLVGSPRAVVTDLAAGGVLSGPRFAFSRSGSLVYVPGPAGGPWSLHWVSCAPQADLGAPCPPASDLERSLVLDRDTPADLRFVESAVAGPSPGRRAVSPTWRADGLEVAFALNKSGPFNLFVRQGAAGPALALNESPWNQTPSSWSPDGRHIVFTEFHPVTGADVWEMDVTTRSRRPLVRTPFDETGARYSPDGRWLAYLTNQSGRWEAVVTTASGGLPPAARLAAGRLMPAGLGPALDGRELRIVEAWFRELAGRMRGPA
jgi:DNA-binding winged helix-turn-helix (wHTH) protein